MQNEIKERGAAMTIDEIKRYTDDEELLKKAEGYLKEIEEDGSCEG